MDKQLHKGAGSMNKALIVLDVQAGIVSQRDVTGTIHAIESVIRDFEARNEPMVFIRHLDYEQEGSPLFHTKVDNLRFVVDSGQHQVVDKSKPNAFSNPALKSWLRDHQVEHIFIIGFNTEYCCLFTAIAAEHEGFKVTLIEDATGTVNTAETYEMPGLDIQDFIGSVLNWSGCIEVLYVDEYRELYSK
ncbi:hypothetical protein PAECIP111890_05346 [Paenibacillus sp. JJ-223]|nr:hypothetical protein PAECIP111890_05346 [Paenibacillus sp. JJ-223]